MIHEHNIEMARSSYFMHRNSNNNREQNWRKNIPEEALEPFPYIIIIIIICQSF